MLLNPRRIPQANALNKYAVNLGATADEVKEYFDVSVYRNVLDMINTFEGVLNRWGMDLHDNVIYLYSYPNYPRMLGQANIGYAIKMSGQSHGWNEIFIYARKQCAKHNLKPLPPTWNTKGTLTGAFRYWKAGSAGTQNHYNNIINNYMALKGAYFNVADLLNLARQINWELNRVRLPIPHNFRQINEKIQGRAYKITPVKYVDLSTDSWEEPTPQGNINNYITLMQLMDVYGQLKQAINTLRVSTRKEIDAANLAKKVQEETLRREQEELISRQQAAAEAEARELEILAEKRAAYEQELKEAEELKIQLAQTREELAAELANLEAAKEAATTEEEIVAVLDKETQVAEAAVKVDQVETDIINREQTLVDAATNLNQEIAEVAQHMEETGQVPAKKTNLTPIILTAITGLLLT